MIIFINKIQNVAHIYYSVLRRRLCEVKWLLIFKSYTYDILIIYIILAWVLIATQLSNFVSVWLTSQQLAIQFSERKNIGDLICNAIIQPLC